MKVIAILFAAFLGVASAAAVAMPAAEAAAQPDARQVHRK